MTQMTQIEPLSLTAVRSVSSVSSVFAFLSRPGRPLPPELSIVLRRLPPERTPASRAMDLALIRYRVIEFAPATARVLQPLVPAMHAVAIVGFVRPESSARRTALGWHRAISSGANATDPPRRDHRSELRNTGGLGGPRPIDRQCR